MKEIEFCVISKETIKPSSSKVIDHSKPFPLSFLDQAIPTIYIPVILFYTANDIKPSQISTKLKTSLSETLSIYYPFSGRVKDNLIIDNYEEGVPFIETRVKTHLTDFLHNPRIEILNQFLPRKPLSYIPNPTETAQVVIQLNIFNCGGIAIGACMSHKIGDGTTMSTFLNSWADSTKKIIPDFSVASLNYPPLEPSLSRTYLSHVEKLWFGDEFKYITKRFVFDDKAIATVQAKGKSETVNNPTRITALSSLIWKSCMEASRSISASSSRQSLSFHAVNIRPRTEPSLPEYSIGNLFFMGSSAGCDKELSLQDLVALTNEAIAKVNQGYLSKLQSVEEFRELLTQSVKEVVLEKPEIFFFTSWINFGFNELDFGWGRPIWVGVTGGIGSTFRNLIIFKKSMCNNGIEAWITLEKEIMDVLENDSEFLTFATPNPSVI